MALLAKYHTLANWTGVNHVGPGGSMTDSATDIPAAGTLTASGDYPSTAIYTNYNGTLNPGLNYRCERGTGFSMVEGGVYWADFYAKFITFGSSGELHNDFSQVRDSGDPANPSPSPAFAIVNGNVTIVRNLWSQTQGSIGTTIPYNSGSAAVGSGVWHHWQLGFKWTEGSAGYFEAWRDGVNTLPTTSAVRTARETSAGASWRFGVYRAPGFAGQTVQWRLWGLEIHNSRPGTVTGPDPGTGTDTTGPSLGILEPASGAVITGNIRYTVAVSDAQSGVASVKYSLIGPSPGVTETVIFTETSAPWDDSDDFNPYNTSALADGTYTFRVVATDVAGNATTANQTVTLENFVDPPATTPPPSVELTVDDATPEIGQVVNFYAPYTDPGLFGNVVISWDFTGTGVFIPLPDTLHQSYTYSTPGPRVVRVKVTDAVSGEAIASVSIDVQEPATVPDPGNPPPDPTVPPPTETGSPGFVTRGEVGIAGTPPAATATSATLYPASTLYPSSSLYPGTVETPGRTRRR